MDQKRIKLLRPKEFANKGSGGPPPTEPPTQLNM